MRRSRLKHGPSQHEMVHALFNDNFIEVETEEEGKIKVKVSKISRHMPDFFTYSGNTDYNRPYQSTVNVNGSTPGFRKGDFIWV